jgi:hypothetical protein
MGATSRAILGARGLCALRRSAGQSDHLSTEVEELASQIVNDLRGPDTIMVQEAEDQDTWVVAADALPCGATDDADGAGPGQAGPSAPRSL